MWDSLANLNLDGTAPQAQTDPSQSDPWSAVINSSPVSDTNVSTAESQMGQQDRNGLCQQFAEEATYGKSGIFPTATDAWNSYMKNGQAYQGNVNKAPSGTLIYYAPDNSNHFEGHVGISDGKGNMVSATDNGIQISNVNQWERQTGQQALGYVKP